MNLLRRLGLVGVVAKPIQIRSFATTMSSLSRRACYKCGNVGHYAEVCSSAERLCYNCKQPGVKRPRIQPMSPSSNDRSQAVLPLPRTGSRPGRLPYTPSEWHRRWQRSLLQLWTAWPSCPRMPQPHRCQHGPWCRCPPNGPRRIRRLRTRWLRWRPSPANML
ncbi:hypothetical protein F4808DRAFT_16737 [Astrocystis sublimbata]|nr:hypothetical protein F4808DRAFT_16737 [Astrocystis sublimbata]